MKLPFTPPAVLAACLLSACVCTCVASHACADNLINSFVAGLKKDAEAGNAEAQFSLGEMFFAGHGVPQDYAEARRWYGMAAAQGHAGAQCGLGEIYAEGKGVPQDMQTAKDWFRKSCNGGDEHGCDAYRHLNASGF